MRRALLAAPALLLLALAGCGPDCDKYCDKVTFCNSGDELSRRQCVDACDESGRDQARTIDCVIDHTCPEIQAGTCSPTGVPGLGTP
jgi:hypothetical protein